MVSFAKHSTMLSHSYWCDQQQLKYVPSKDDPCRKCFGQKIQFFNLKVVKYLPSLYVEIKALSVNNASRVEKGAKVKTNFERARAVNTINHAQLDHSKNAHDSI